MKPIINNPGILNNTMRPPTESQTSSLPAYEDIEMQAAAVTSPEPPNPPNSRNSTNEAPILRPRIHQRRARSACRNCRVRSRFFHSLRQQVLFWISLALLLIILAGQVLLYGAVVDQPTTICKRYPEVLAMSHGGFVTTMTVILGALTFVGGLFFCKGSPGMIMTFVMMAFACWVGVSFYFGGLVDPSRRACPGSVRLLRDNGTWPGAGEHVQYFEVMK